MSAGQREITDITGATSQNWKLERFLRGRPDASIVITGGIAVSAYF
jgi:hypothetical protein